MKALAGYIMRGRVTATLLTAAFAVMSMLLPPISYLSGASVGLVTLRKGPSEGLINMVGAAAIIWLLAALTTGYTVLAIAFGLAVWMPVWMLAVVLRRTISLPLTIVVAGLLCAAAVVGLHAAIADPAAWWREILNGVFSSALEPSGGVPGAEELAAALEKTAQVMTGLMGAALFVSMVCSLLLARWWQAGLYNPGGFRREFHDLRLGKGPAAVVLVVLLAATVTSGELASVTTDLATVLLTVFGLCGLALVHDTMARKKWKAALLIVLYVLLLIALPQILVLLALLGLSDSWLNLRRFLPADQHVGNGPAK